MLPRKEPPKFWLRAVILLHPQRVQDFINCQSSLSAGNFVKKVLHQSRGAKVFLPKSVASVIWDAVRKDAPVHVAIWIYCLISLAITLSLSNESPASLLVYVQQRMGTLFLFMPCLVLAGDMILVVTRYNQKRWLAYRVVFSLRRIGRLLAGMILLLSVSLFFGAFTSIKTLLPTLTHGFLYDRQLADLDRWLHGGVHPWSLLWSIPYARQILPVVQFNYGIVWYAICFGALFFVATSPKADGIRVRYFASYFFTWIFLGNIVAGIWISAGPAFYGFVTQDHACFETLLAALATDTSSISARLFQEYLWSLHESGLAAFGSGISAFPSVHVGLIVMNSLYLWDYSRRLGTIAFAYCALILASSVYLGWHYALDGYVSALVVIVAHQAFKFRWRGLVAQRQQWQGSESVF